jgi:hypothetical protein
METDGCVDCAAPNRGNLPIKAKGFAADPLSMVQSMFQATRHLFHRNPTSSLQRAATAQTRPAAKPGMTDSDRHPAMRGLSISPVHGHHCICDRCSQQRAA